MKTVLDNYLQQLREKRFRKQQAPRIKHRIWRESKQQQVKQR